jgi:hypothetical protein
MRIKFEVSGGVAGMQLPAKEVDCSQLDEVTATRWKQALEHANFFALARTSLSDKGYDLTQYTITVEDGSRLHQVTFDDLTMTEPLSEIVERLQAE